MSTRTKLLSYMVETGKLLPRKEDPAIEQEEAGNAVEWDIPPPSPLWLKIQEIMASGSHPLIQADIVDSFTLLEVLRGGESHRLTPWRLARTLSSHYFRRLGPMRWQGRNLNVWTSAPTQSLSDFKALLRQRVSPTPILAKGELTPFESQVLALRLRRVGLRYFRPREIAKMLGEHPSAIYAASQSIAKKLGLSGLSDIAAVRRALMDDPVFR